MPFSIEQAANWLQDLKTNLTKKVKKAVADDAQISMALPRDRAKFLQYAISVLHKVDSEHMNLFYKVTGRIPSSYSSTQLAELFRMLLALRVGGYSIEQIAQHLHTPIETMKKVELIAIDAVSAIIKKERMDGVPIIGGLN